MAYGHKSGDCRVYAYGVSRSALHHGQGENLDLARAEMQRRVALWNRLVEIHHETQDRKETVLAGCPLVTVTRRGKEVQRRELSPEVKAQLDAIDDETRERVNEACRDSGCYWPNYSEVKMAWDQARRRPGELRFHSAAREVGKITTLLPNGLSVTDAYGYHGFLRIRQDNPRYPRDARVSMRIGSDGRAPVWLTLPVVMHRPLPTECRIKAVSALCERLADTERWRVVFVLDRPEGVGTWATQSSAGRSGNIAIDVGWRRVPGGLRVATWRDDRGQTGELVLPERYIEQQDTVQRLKSHRDTLYNETLASLRAWLAVGERPSWLRDETAYLHQWRKAGRLVRLMRTWESRRFRGDEAIFAMLAGWQSRDRHLWQYLDHLRDQCLHWRREIYRVWVADITRRYAEVVLEDVDLSQVARRQDEQGEQNPLVQKARYYRTIAGVYQLRQSLESTCKREGIPIARRPAAYTTMQCAQCGSIEEWDHRELYHTCTQCGTRWDQDHNAARNLLSSEQLLGVGAS